MNETSSNEFFMDFAATIMETEVPLQKVSHPAIKYFSKVHFEKKC